MIKSESYPKKHSESAEQLLINQAVSGSKEAFAQLYSLYYQELILFAYRHVKNFDISEQLVQQTFLNALKNIHHYKNNGAPFGAFLYKIIRNLIINYHNRDQKKYSGIELDTIVDIKQSRTHHPDGVLESVVARELGALLTQAIEMLPYEQRRVVELKLEHGLDLSNKEIGEMMKKTEGSIKSLYHRAQVKLRKILSQYLGKE